MVKKKTGKIGLGQQKFDGQQEIVQNQLNNEEQPNNQLEIVEQPNWNQVEPGGEIAEQDEDKLEGLGILEEKDESIEVKIQNCRKSLRAIIIQQLTEGLPEQEAEQLQKENKALKTQLELLQQLKELNEQVEAPRKQTEQWKGPTGKKQNKVPNNLPVF